MLSVVVPAHNEEKLLPQTLLAIAKACADIEHEVIVADDSSDDRTAAVSKEHGAKVARTEARQIAAARNAGASRASGDYLLFVDADTEISAGAVRNALRTLDAGAVGGGVYPSFDGRTPLWSRVFLWMVTASFRLLRYPVGCFVFCRRDAYDAIGGFDERYYASEEIHFARALKRHGRFEITKGEVVTSGRKVRTYSLMEIAWISVRSLSWPAKMRKRKGLELWYGPRREDPGA